MGAKTGISWTNRTWNYLRGCSRKSAGCIYCYAEQMAARFSGPGQPYEGLAEMGEDGRGHWTGKVVAVPDHLDDPIRWQTPSMIFTNSMSDLYHERAELNMIVNSFEVMELADWHIYQTLTKRPERMASILPTITLKSGRNLGTDPLPHVWAGTSIEDEKAAAERSIHLANTPAAIRWGSAEPLIGEVDWERWLPVSKANWVVFGGESRQGGIPRPMKLEWVRQGIAACRKLGIPVFVKQLGWHWARETFCDGKFRADPSGKKMICWPEDLRIQEYPVDVQEALKWDGKAPQDRKNHSA
jgi:protein gp37